MADSSLLINSTDQTGNKLQRSVTYTNDAADRDKMLTFAQGINGLLTNNFVEAKRVQKVDLDEEPDGGWKPGGGAGYDVIPYPEAASTPDASKTTPTITFSPANTTLQDVFNSATGYIDVTITYNGDGTLYIDYISSVGTNWMCAIGAVIINGTTLRIIKNVVVGYVGDPVNLVVRSTTTDTCNPASATFTITGIA